MTGRVLWGVWAVIPVLVLAYHFGPGQGAMKRDDAARQLASARQLERAATAAQGVAHRAQMARIESQRAAFATGDEDDKRIADAALEVELEAYSAASDAWKSAADAFSEVEALLGTGPGGVEARWAKSRALVRAGEVWNGIGELESILEAEVAAGRGESELALATREELAAAHYYGARLLREEGRPATQWLEASGVARQQYRYLAERSARDQDEALAGALQRNVERVLDLEQTEAPELVGRPLPKDSPRARRPGDCEPGLCNGRGRRPSERKGGNGAGNLLEIGPGW